MEHYSQIARQVGLNDFKKGVDSFEIRLWNRAIFNGFEELYIIRKIDTTFSFSYFRIYVNDMYGEKWDPYRNPYKQPIVDSVIAKQRMLKSAEIAIE